MIPLVHRKVLGLLLGCVVSSTAVAAETQPKAKAAKTSRKPKTQAESPAEPPKSTPAVATAKSTTAEGVLLFDSVSSRGRPRVALVFKESDDFKNVPDLTGIKTPEPPPPATKPQLPSKEPAPSSPEKKPPTDQPVAREKTPEELEAQKVENAAAEAAELPVDLGPVE